MSSPISIRDQMVFTASNGRPFFDVLAQLNIDAIELQLDADLTTPHVRQPDGSPFVASSDAGVEALKRALASRRIRVSAILLATDFSSENAAEHVTWTIQAVRIAQQLGAPAVRVDPLSRNKELSASEVRDRFIAGISQVLRQTDGLPVDLGIENHGPFGNDPAFLDHIFNAVNHPRFGLTLDTGNFYWWGVPLEELYRLFEKYAPLTKHTHIKNINYPPDLANLQRPAGIDYAKYCCALDEGNIDLRRIIGILRRAGFRRDYCIENESLTKVREASRLDILRRDVRALQSTQ